MKVWAAWRRKEQAGAPQVVAKHGLKPSHSYRLRRTKQSRRVVSLPSEIWAYIASMLPKDQLAKLACLNSTFFKAALDARYKEVYLPPGSRPNDKLHHLSHSHIASRVKELRFSVECFFGEFDSGPSILPHRIRQRAMNVLTRRRTIRRRQEEKISHLADLSFVTVHYFSNVTSFHINGIGFELTPQLVRPFLKAAWNTFGSNLEELDIKAELGSFPEFLPPPDLQLPRLRKFRLRVDLVSSSSEVWQYSSPGTDELSGFLSNVAPSLEALDVTCFPWHGPDLPKILNDIGCFPLLQSFSIATYDHSNPLAGSFDLASFIHRHSHTLRFLEVPPHNVNTIAEDATQDSGCETGDIQALSLTSQRSDHYQTSNLQAAQFYVERWRHSLTTLELNMHFLKHAELTTLMSCLVGQAQLKDFTLAVRALSPQLFNLLSTTAVGLQKLTVLFYQICPDHVEEKSLRALRQIEDPPDYTMVTRVLLRELSKRDFTHWPLEELNLHASWHILETASGIGWKALQPAILLLERRIREVVTRRNRDL